MSLEAAERIAAKPAFLLAFNTSLVALWIMFGVDVANIMISIVTAELVLLGVGAARRSQLALHAKLDELIAATEGARDDLQHVEDLAEQEIAEKRL